MGPAPLRVFLFLPVYFVLSTGWGTCVLSLRLAGAISPRLAQLLVDGTATTCCFLFPLETLFFSLSFWPLQGDEYHAPWGDSAPRGRVAVRCWELHFVSLSPIPPLDVGPSTSHHMLLVPRCSLLLVYCFLKYIFTFVSPNVAISDGERIRYADPRAGCP